jgi:RNA polymerase sigma factor (sigma-70 family)
MPMMMDDSQWLAACANNRAAEGFGGLVERHIDFVYAAALRQTGDPHLAQDITQAVFLLLLQRAGRIKAGTLMKGWLFRTTRYVVANARRAQARRKFHEREAAAMRLGSVCEDHWPDVEPHLDDALAELSEKDRRVLLLRFFDGLPLAALGEAIGVSEQAAQKRVERALDRLRQLLARRGAGVAGVSLGGMLQASVAQAAPAHLAKATVDLALNAATGAAQSSVAFSLAKGTACFMATAKIKIIAAIVVICLFIGSTTVIVIHYAPSLLAQTVQPDPGAAAPVPLASAPSDINSVYSLQNGEILKRIVDAPSDDRNRFVKEQSLQEGSSTLFIGWYKYRFQARMYLSNPHYTLRQLVNFICFARVMSGSEFQMDDSVANLPLTGDILFKQDATDDELCAGLTTFMHNELGTDAGVAFRDVPTKVIVLSGHWKYTPVPQAPPVDKTTDPEAVLGEPCIEIYSDETLDPKSEVTGSSYTNREHFARNLSNALNQKVIFEGVRLPESLSIRSHGDVPGDVRGRLLVLRHVEEQTGLTGTEETRPVHRLFIEAKKATP